MCLQKTKQAQHSVGEALLADKFDTYYEIFRRAGRPLGENDRLRSCREWLSLGSVEGAGWEDLAIADARRVCATASAPQFVPIPLNHLLQRPWTRRTNGREHSKREVCPLCCDTGLKIVNEVYARCECTAGSMNGFDARMIGEKAL